MKTKLKCFLSYAYADRNFVQKELVPILHELGLDAWDASERITIGSPFKDEILRGIRESHIIIAVFNQLNPNVNFEVGAAAGQNKPILGIFMGESIPFDLQDIFFLKYSESAKHIFSAKFRRAVEIFINNLIAKSVLAVAEVNSKIIGISIGTENLDVEQELRFTADFLSLIKKISGFDSLSLLQTRKGSFTSFFSIDFKYWANLIEKIIFFIPEWQKKKVENLKIHAEIKKVEAETNHLNIESKIAEERLKIEQANAMLELLQKYKELGIKVQFGDDVLLSIDNNGLLSITKPETIE